MKVFVATAQGQGTGAGDFSWTVEGELVRFPGLTCDCPDCGCDRAMAGLASSKATTTFTVENRPELDQDSYREAFVDALVREGWIEDGRAVDRDIQLWIDEHLELAAQFSVGEILEVQDGIIRLRGSRALGS